VRVALDGTPLTVSSGGTRRYTIELVRALVAAFPDDTICLMSDQAFEQTLSLPYGRGSVMDGRLFDSEPRASASGFWLDRYWWLFGLSRQLRQERIDVFHGTNFETPLLPLRPSVLTLLDLSPWKNAQWHHGASRVRRRTPLLIHLRIPTIILTISEAIRKEAIEFFRLPPQAIIAVPLAAAASLRPVETRSGVEPYFLYAGTLEPRKNIPTLIEAWRLVKKVHPVRLVLAGRSRADFVEPTPEPGLELLGEVPDSDLPRLYSECVACVYPSLYEGFGLPVLEAMQCGAPVLTSRDAAITEVAGGAAMQMDAHDVQSWKESMLAVFQNHDLSGRLRTLSLRRAQEFSWERTARLTRDVYEEAIRRFESD
jgi:glycosyltransferase involved in cell wall biosynthesis